MPAATIVKLPASRDWAERIGGVTCAFFWNETYGFGVFVAWPVNFAQLSTIIRHYEIASKSDLEQLDGTEIRGGQYFFFAAKERHVIAFSKRSAESCDVGEIAHEALHCVRNALRRRAVSCDYSDGEEAHAYALGWLTNKIAEARRIIPHRDLSK